MTPPRSAIGAPPQGGTASGPAEPVPRRSLDRFVAIAGRASERRALTLLAISAASGLALAGWGLFSSAPARSVPAHAVALINGKPILRSDWRAQVEALQGEPWDKTTPAQRQEALQSMIEEELFVQRGLELGLPDSDAEVRAALAGSVRTTAGADAQAKAPDEAALRAWFEAHRDRYGNDFEAARRRLPLDLRRAEQQAAEQKLARHLRDKSTVLLAPDAAP